MVSELTLAHSLVEGQGQIGLMAHNTFLQPQYIALESLCQDYGFELLGMCRNQSEVTAVLNDLGEDSETEPEAEGLGQAFEEGIPNLARLRLAVNYNQKQVSWALPYPGLLSCLL